MINVKKIHSFIYLYQLIENLKSNFKKQQQELCIRIY